MYFTVDHLTRYEYSVPVTLGEQLLRFCPRKRPGQEVGQFRLEITPTPDSCTEDRDPWGNPLHRARFSGDTSVLAIQVHMEARTRPDPSADCSAPSPMPLDYRGEAAELAPFLEPLEQPDRLAPFVDPLMGEAGTDSCRYLRRLNEAVHGFYHSGIRLEGGPRSPAETVQRQEGVCRDLAVLFIAGCRHFGIPARFASGYQKGDGRRDRRFLHAWAEACLPGQGWIGFDPTHGSLVGEDHLLVAAAPRSQATTPVEGGYTYHGPEVTSTLITDVRIEAG